MLTPFRVAILLPILVLVTIPVAQHFSLPLVAANPSIESTPRTLTPPNKQLVYANGVVEGMDRSTPLRFEVRGRIASLHVEVGESVVQGQVLAELHATDWQVDLTKAKAQLQQAEAQHQLLLAGATEESINTARAEARTAYEDMLGAKAQYERVLKVKSEGIITGEEMDRRKSTYLKSRATYMSALARVKEIAADTRVEELKAAEAKVALAASTVMEAENALNKTRLIAPFDGIILERWGELGELAGPDLERPIVAMVNDGEKRVRAYVEELDAMNVGVGDQVVVATDGRPDMRAEGEIIRCAPAMVDKSEFNDKPGERTDTRVREVTIRLVAGDASDSLLIGQPVDVTIEIPRKTPQGADKSVIRESQNIPQIEN